MRAGVLSWILLLGLPAGAYELKDDAFRMEFAADGLCIAYPPEATRSDACAGVDVAGLHQQAQSGKLEMEKANGRLLSLAVLRQGDWMALLLVAREALTGQEPFSKQEISEHLRVFAQGAGEGMGGRLEPHGDTPARTYERVSLAGTVGIRSTLIAQAPLAPGIDRSVVYVLFSPTNAHYVTAMTDAAHEKKARELIERWLDAARVPPVSENVRARFDQDSGFEQGRRVGFIFGRMLLLALLAGVGGWLFMLWRGRRSR